VAPQIPGKHLRNGQLVDLTGPGAHHFPLPEPAVGALLSQ
jgi:hypothetical protein